MHTNDDGPFKQAEASLFLPIRCRWFFEVWSETGGPVASRCCRDESNADLPIHVFSVPFLRLVWCSEDTILFPFVQPLFCVFRHLKICSTNSLIVLSVLELLVVEAGLAQTLWVVDLAPVSTTRRRA
jgi:hypothetical protein